ncbi:MAG TPA: methyltransferase domain-containing protein [Capillimicrobium sp.]|nr:methyltransferase domain-containing protein [Capillimicrobium sp.]
MSGDELIEDAIALPALAGRELLILRPRDAEALLDEEAFEHEEFLPSWAELWPSALALADAVAARALHGARVVELGCGLGLPAIAAALAGGRVLATDWAPDAVAMAARNAERNGAAVETLVASWAQPEALVARGPFDLVIGSDLLYEARNGPQLLALLPRLVADGGEAWIADPGRAPAEGFLADARAAGFEVRSRPAPAFGPRVHVHRLRR